MKKYYTIKELCKLTSVSIRTLHYYDEINILKPNHRTGKGHRLYSEKELFRLQQIVTLKFVGLSLTQIQQLIDNKKMNITDLLTIQLNALSEETKKIEKISDFLNYLINQLHHKNDIDWYSVAKIIEVINAKPSDTKRWYEKYFTGEELLQFYTYARKRTADWLHLFNLTKNNLHMDPKSQFGKDLAKKWMNLIEERYGHIPTIKKKLWDAYKAGMIPRDYFPYDKEVIAYLEAADERFKI
ncbi:MAG: MerR family transcriptional regulator [Gammaproteobacteria bacterium]|nr:MerR family transcriptional regulator [Gammaproteobacteria bacterium]